MSLSARLARVVLVLGLLAGWQAALLHPLLHVDGKGSLVHIPGSVKDHGKSAKGLCDALGALNACVAAEVAALGASDLADVLPEHFSFERRVAEPPPFLAQGPPALA